MGVYVVLMRYVALTLLFTSLLTAKAYARPVSYPDGWMFMQMNDGQQNSGMLSYSPTAKDAFGVRTDYLRDEKNWLHTFTYNRLLQRWNTSDSQANIYLLSGLGASENSGDISPAATIGLEADWETRRLYTSYENRYIAADNINESYNQKVRFGVAPYIADYDDVHTWLMLEVSHTPTAEDNVVVTPFVRLFTTEVLGEFGISNKKDVLFNLTLQF